MTSSVRKCGLLARGWDASGWWSARSYDSGNWRGWDALAAHRRYAGGREHPVARRCCNDEARDLRVAHAKVMHVVLVSAGM
jgi:hypothetical protein